MPSLNKRRWRFHGLKKPKVRQDWNKYNLYNLSRLSVQNTATRTYFQQKWTAKASTRAYHGEVIREQQWERMFSRTAHAVVPMDPRYLAENDGSEHAAGRGRGLEQQPTGKERRPPQSTPYMQMVYHPTERRLDTAIFRALFASSTRQARQFVVHGQVKVNGKKMIYPGYLLNPGDMFQVEPERVLFGTGAWKQSQVDETFFDSMTAAEAAEARDSIAGRKKKRLLVAGDASKVATNAQPEPDEEEVIEEEDESEEEISPTDPLAATKKQIQSLRLRTKDIIANPPQGVKLSGRRKQELRAFNKNLKTHLSRAAAVTPSTLDDLETQLQGLVSRIPAPLPASTSTTSTNDSASAETTSSLTPTPETIATSSTSTTLLAPPHVENPRDLTKPYATPWRPRDFMPAFAFIPRYLEVQQNICSAVYLRHPVCKPGLAEVPTPFHPETGQLAFNYYLRRGR